MARDIYFDKMMYDSQTFAFRNGNIKEGLRVIEFFDDGENTYVYSDYLFKEKWLKAANEGDQIQIGSSLEGKESEFILFILGIINNDVYYGLYKQSEPGSQKYSLVENGYLNSEEALHKNVCLGNENHFFCITLQCPEIGFDVKENTRILENY